MSTVDFVREFRPSYFDPHREGMIEHAEACLKGKHFDTMVGRGLSGALIIPKMAEALGKEWLIVRKPSDNSHSMQPAVGRLGKRWVFVDDFVSTGKTREACKETVAKIRPDAVYAGTYSYRDDEFTPARKG